MNDTYIKRFITNTNKLNHKNLSTEITMKTKLSSVLCVILMSWPISGFTQTKGFSIPDCGQWLKNNNVKTKTWLVGYLSGLNFNKKNKNALEHLNSVEQAYLFVDNYCKKNPLETVGVAGALLYIDLMKKNKK